MIYTLELYLRVRLAYSEGMTQRHTAKRVFDRLHEECSFTGGYTIIKDYMRERAQRRQEVFVPLSHPPGHGRRFRRNHGGDWRC